MDPVYLPGVCPPKPSVTTLNTPRINQCSLLDPDKLQMRRKAETLQHRHNATEYTTPRMSYIKTSALRKGSRARWCYRPTSAEQYPASASGVWCDGTMLHYDPSVPFVPIGNRIFKQSIAS